MRANHLIPFGFDDHLVRVILREGEPWFVAADVCRVLSITNPTMACSNLDDDEKGLSLTETLGGEQGVLVVSEGGLWTIVLRSRAATTPGSAAHRFRKWVTGELLPQVRKAGRVGAPAGAAPVSEHHVRLIREARLLFGDDAARTLWHEIGLPVTPEMGGRRITDDVADHLGRYIAARLEAVPGAVIPGAVVWNDYVAWAAANGIVPVSRTMFGRRLPGLGVAKKVGSDCVRYAGVQLSEVRH
ncbi:BRO family protein [Xanthobacter sp.]|uniref:BRO-N domain-containing protein n=1 Tax=Xanthobacter sp. TaxID=35809 RepID=UPI002600283B|nr:BRO family protein [Xanthobacter sp.]